MESQDLLIDFVISINYSEEGYFQIQSIYVKEITA